MTLTRLLLCIVLLSAGPALAFATDPPDPSPNKENVMNKQKAPDGGPTAQETAARTVGGDTATARGTTHARGNVAPAVPRHYEDTNQRPDGMPLPPQVAPEAHGGHYYSAEDREKYKFVAGYDKGLAPGYDPTKEHLAGAPDERGKYERKPWQSPKTGEEGTAIIKRNFDGSRSTVGILAIDPSGNLVTLPPDTTSVKQGWRFASQQDCNDAARKAEDLNRKDEEDRKASASAKPAQPVAAAPTLQSTESPEARKAREEKDPALQAIRHGESKSTAERDAAGPASVSAPAERQPSPPGPEDRGKK